MRGRWRLASLDAALAAIAAVVWLLQRAWRARHELQPGSSGGRAGP